MQNMLEPDSFPLALGLHVRSNHNSPFLLINSFNGLLEPMPTTKHTEQKLTHMGLAVSLTYYDLSYIST